MKSHRRLRRGNRRLLRRVVQAAGQLEADKINLARFFSDRNRFDKVKCGCGVMAFIPPPAFGGCEREINKANLSN